MKKPFVTLICLLVLFALSQSLIAQELKEFNTKKTEVNIGVANIFAKNNILYPYYYIDGQYYLPYVYSEIFRRPELVIGIKFHTEKGAFRLGTNFNYYSITTEDKSGGIDKYISKVFSSKINLGYEWHHTFSRLVIYYGMDISSSYANNNMKYEYSNSNGSTVSQTKVNEMTIGVNPLIGTNFFITPNLSIGTEVKFTSEYVSGKSTEETSDSPTSYETKSSGMRTYFGPLGFISINLHF